MRLIRPRIRLSSLLIAIAVAAVAGRLAFQHHHFATMAAFHESRTFFAGPASGSLLRGIHGLDSAGRNLWDWEVAWHQLMAQRYRRAAWMPWLPEPSEPPRETFRQDYYRHVREQYDEQERARQNKTVEISPVGVS